MNGVFFTMVTAYFKNDCKNIKTCTGTQSAYYFGFLFNLLNLINRRSCFVTFVEICYI